MGLCFSSKPSTFKNIRVVHLNGYVQEFENPITVSEITGKPLKHFVFTHEQLLSPGSKHMKPENVLEPGNVYFLIPFSIFQSCVSPLDLIPIAKKLSDIAKNGNSRCKVKPGKNISRKGSPDRFSRVGMGMVVENGNDVRRFSEMERSRKLRPWKPILSTIREISFNRRSESDLSEKNVASCCG